MIGPITTTTGMQTTTMQPTTNCKKGARTMRRAGLIHVGGDWHFQCSGESLERARESVDVFGIALSL